VNKDQGEIPRGVYPERQSEILRSAQNDKRRAQDDKRRARNDRQFQSSAPPEGGKCVLAREYDPVPSGHRRLQEPGVCAIRRN